MQIVSSHMVSPFFFQSFIRSNRKVLECLAPITPKKHSCETSHIGVMVAKCVILFVSSSLHFCLTLLLFLFCCCLFVSASLNLVFILSADFSFSHTLFPPLFLSYLSLSFLSLFSLTSTLFISHLKLCSSFFLFSFLQMLPHHTKPENSESTKFQF